MNRRQFLWQSLGGLLSLPLVSVFAKRSEASPVQSGTTPPREAVGSAIATAYFECAVDMSSQMIYGITYEDGTKANRDDWHFEFLDDRGWHTCDSALFGGVAGWLVPENASRVRVTPVKSLLPVTARMTARFEPDKQEWGATHNLFRPAPKGDV